MSHVSDLGRRFLAGLTVLGLTAATLALASTASADTAPADPATPTTVAADSLPTVQINGVVWDQQVVGNTVYVVGRFTKARPAGAAPGTNEVTRNNMLAYDVRTGVLVSSFAPDLNGEVLNVAASPDGSRVYIAGSFTSANGQTRYRGAAYNTATGALDPTFRPSFDGQTRAVVATPQAVYYGGNFSKVGSKVSTRLAAVNPSNGVALTGFTASAEQRVNALTMNPSNDKLVVGGAFRQLNADTVLGIGAVNPGSGVSEVWRSSPTVTGYDSGSAFLSLDVDNDSVYGTAYNFYGPGNLEGAFRADGQTGDITWVQDCHGDTYSVHPSGGSVYTAGHPHYCGNIGGFPQTDPWTFYHGTAFTKKVTGTITADPHGYHNFEGTPSPTLLNFFPRFTPSNFTGANQATWSVDGNSDYVVYGGEFTAVNGTAQQGLSRFAVRAKAPNKIGPNSNDGLTPAVASFKAGTARVAWQATHDQDNTSLTYKVYRDGGSTPVYQTTRESTFWQRPTLGFVDTGLRPGQRYRYAVTATDPLGNVASRGTTAVTVADSASDSPYADAVIADGASAFYRLGEGGTKSFDWIGFDDANVGTGVTGAQEGATSDANPASTFDGTDKGTVVTPSAVRGPNTFAIEAWVKTTSRSGGKIVGFGNNPTGTSGSYDRHVYMDNDGRIIFGVYPNAVRTISSRAGYNDGAYHHVVANLGSNGMTLYVDGKLVASRGDTTNGQDFTGYWRIGGDNVGGWPNQPASNYLSGTIDDVAIYPTTLSRTQVDAHWAATGRTSNVAPRPADALGAAVYDDEPTLYWRLGEAQSTDTARDSGPSGQDGSYYGDPDRGVEGVTSQAGPATRFDGNDDGVASQETFTNPRVYSQELWFKTTTTGGGKLMGFGSNPSGNSGGYDRHVYMFDDGRLRFGVWTGFTNVIDSEKSYNDGAWHQVVATQGPDGMALYVDGENVGRNGQTDAQDYTGHWRIGGDTTWGGNSSNWFDGTLDEYAVFGTVLTQSQIRAHYRAGGGQLPNEKPTADFTSQVAKGKVSFDAGGSSDPDGTIADYAWTFGDGSSGTGRTPDHTYEQAGEYSVTLTVTDDRGGSGSVTKTVTAGANAAPTARFTSSVETREATFEASSSSDADGSIATYDWSFGDGTSGTGASARHRYTTAGEYTVTLTVTDDDGATGTVTRSITVTNAPPRAAFSSTSSKRVASFDASASSDADGTVETYSWSFGDGGTATGRTPQHTYASTGSYDVTLTVTDSDGASASVTKTVTLTANVAPKASFSSSSQGLKATFDAGSSSDEDGTVDSYAWTFGDGSTGTGRTAERTYATGGTYEVRLTVTDDDGSSDSITRSVTVSAPPVDSTFARDTFDRTVSNGWGASDQGGPWSVSTGSASRFSVANGAGSINLHAAGASAGTFLNGVSQTSTDTQVEVSTDKVLTGSGMFVWLNGRGTAANGYRTRLKVGGDGTVQIALSRTVGGAETVWRSTNVSGLTVGGGDVLNVRMQVSGTSPTTLRARVWKKGTSEPTTWQVSDTDTSTGLQVAGGLGVIAYLGGSVTNAPVAVRFDNLVSR